METIQVVLELELLAAVDRAVRKLKTNRSALMRDALRAHLRRLDQIEREKADREGYARYPDALARSDEWDKVADWPDE
jgi:metal-responsive CopG/Arc/MetJ family transcriptional regulator